MAGMTVNTVFALHRLSLEKMGTVSVLTFTEKAPSTCRLFSADQGCAVCLLPQKKKEVSCYPLPGGHRNHILPVPVGHWLCPEMTMWLHKAFSQHLGSCIFAPSPFSFKVKVVRDAGGAEQDPVISHP